MGSGVQEFGYEASQGWMLYLPLLRGDGRFPDSELVFLLRSFRGCFGLER